MGKRAGEETEGQSEEAGYIGMEKEGGRVYNPCMALYNLYKHMLVYAVYLMHISLYTVYIQSILIYLAVYIIRVWLYTMYITIEVRLWYRVGV